MTRKSPIINKPTSEQQIPIDSTKNLSLKGKIEFRMNYVIIFALVFALVGGYAIFKSFAAGTPTPYSLTSTITDGSTISGTVDWSVSLSPQPQAVEFYIDGVKDSTIDSSSPYSYKGTSNSLDTTKLSNGNHTIQEIAIYASASTIATHKVIVNNQAQVPPSSAPIISLYTSPSTVSAGSSSVITWTSTNATACSASGAWSGSKLISGSQTVTPSATSTYTLTCSGPGGSSSSNVILQVITSTPTPTPIPPPTTIPPAVDTTKPSTPTSLKVVSTSRTSISLSWNASKDNVAVNRYNIYRNNNYLGYVNSPNLSATNSGLISSSTYEYFVVASDAAGNLSDPSQKVCVGSWSLWSYITGGPQRSSRDC